MRNPKETVCPARLVGVTLPRAGAEEKKILKDDALRVV
jgi:hypothetical protein